MALSNLTISRTALRGGLPLTVSLTVSGTAVFGVNYEVVSGADSATPNAMTVTIPLGQLSKTVVLNTIGPAVATSKTVIFTVATGAEYVDIFPATQTLTISSEAVGDILDRVAVPSLIAYGFRRLRSAYAGAACRIRHSVSNAEVDIDFLSTGMLDVAAILTFAGSDSAFVTKIYNQGLAGASYPMVQTTATDQPALVVNGVLQTKQGRPSMLQASGRRMIIPSLALMGSNNQNFTINYVAGQVGTLNRKILEGSPTSNWFLGFYVSLYRSFYFNGVGNFNTSPSINIPVGDNNLKIYSAISNVNLTLNASVYENGIAYNNANVPSVLPPTNLASNGFTESSNCFFSEFVAYNQALTIPQLQIIENSQKLYFGVS